MDSLCAWDAICKLGILLVTPILGFRLVEPRITFASPPACKQVEVAALETWREPPLGRNLFCIFMTFIR